MFKHEEKVYLVTEKTAGIVKEIDIANGRFKCTYYNKNDVRHTEWFHADYIRKYKKPLEIKIKYFTDIEKIQAIDVGNWIDLRAAEDVELKVGEYNLIKLGVGMKLPKGYEAHVVPRSSTFKTWGILQTNHFGVIDNSYSGNDDQWRFPAYATRDTAIKKNDRICQFRIEKIQPKLKLTEVENLDEISRGGFGSTGKA